MMQFDLETHKNYKRIWNNNLWWVSATQPLVPSADLINRVKNFGVSVPVGFPISLEGYLFVFSVELPAPIDNGQRMLEWSLASPMSKPGVSSYDMPTYEMVQYGRFKNKSDAGKFVDKNIGKIVKPKKGDFEINNLIGGNWMMEGAEIRNDGERWIASLTYIHSVDNLGWDKDIYEDKT